MQKRNILKLFVVILFVATGTYVYWLLYRKPVFGIDDANIFFIYMRNLVEGHGFVYTPGGERVEGFTSLLFTLLGSIFFLFSGRPEIFLLLLNILLVSITLWQIIIFADKLFGDTRLLSPFACFILGAVLLLPGYLDWTILTLMETGLWSCILVSLVLTICRFELENENRMRDQYLFSALLVLMVLCRPESYLWGMVFLSIRYLQLRKLKNHSDTALPVKSILLPLVCFIAAVSAITLWRLSYFGYPFPNTYYVKVSTDRIANFMAGLRYDYLFFSNNFFMLLVFSLAVVYVVDSIRKKSQDKLKYCSAIIFTALVVALAVPIYTGGDHFGQVRFIQPVVPLFYLIFFIIMMEHFHLYKIRIRMYTAVAVTLLVLLFSPGYNIIDYALRSGVINNEFVIATKGRALGDEMSDFFARSSSLPTVGVITAGAQPYTYKGRSIDLLGLNTISIAHAPGVKSGEKNHAAFNKKIFYRLAPDIVSVTGFISDTTRNTIEAGRPDKNHVWYYSVYKGIFDDEEFKNTYPFVCIFKKNENNFLLTYANKNFLSQLDTTFFSYKIINE